MTTGIYRHGIMIEIMKDEGTWINKTHFESEVYL